MVQQFQKLTKLFPSAPVTNMHRMHTKMMKSHWERCWQPPDEQLYGERERLVMTLWSVAVLRLTAAAGASTRRPPQLCDYGDLLVRRCLSGQMQLSISECVAELVCKSADRYNFSEPEHELLRVDGSQPTTGVVQRCAPSNCLWHRLESLLAGSMYDWPSGMAGRC